jgi:malonate-semialdehyde dehydrogenase (acetylating)/methylmalonate-semialdehyde dehydrogenase
LTVDRTRAPRLARNYIGGRWVDADTTETLDVRDPATGATLGRLPLSTPADADRAVVAAAAAFRGWRETPVVERARVLFRLKTLLEAHVDEIAATLTSEHGKTLAEARGEIRRGIENVEHACGIPSLMMGEALEDIAPGIDCETIRQPLGVFVGVTPYNFPVMIPMWFWPYAVATGNTFVLKPSEQDPLTHQRVIELAEEAGLPAGVLNVVHGDGRVVEALLAHPDVRGVSFVGSSAVARQIYARAAAEGKRAQALGGAKNHMIVLPDADYDQVGRVLLDSLFGSTGQRCLAGSVVVGVDEAYEPVRDRFLEGASAIRIGHGLDDDVDMGPVISERHRNRILDYVRRGSAEGAELVLDRTQATVAAHPRGHWVGPAVFEGVTPAMDIGRDEIFGPVAALSRAASLDDAVALMHESAYGNATSIFTTSGRAAREFRYRAGISMIGVNIGVAAPMAFFPFGGSRNSFFGDLKAQGRDAVEFYTDRRVVISRW